MTGVIETAVEAGRYLFIESNAICSEDHVCRGEDRRRRCLLVGGCGLRRTDIYFKRFYCIFCNVVLYISFIEPPNFSETRTPRSTFFVAQATNPDENEDENEP